MSAIKKIVLAYSGGLDTSVILKWLKETYQCPVVAFAADLGQGEELAEVAAKAKATGADEVLSRTSRKSSSGTSSGPCSGPTPSMKGPISWAPPSPGP